MPTPNPNAALASEEVASMVHAFDDKGRKDAVRKLAERVRQLENELRYCIEIIEDNLDVKNDLQFQLAKRMVKRPGVIVPAPVTPPTEKPKEVVHFIHCSNCGKAVSTPMTEGTVVRAWVECPECVAKQKP